MMSLAVGWCLAWPSKMDSRVETGWWLVESCLGRVSSVVVLMF